MTYTICEWDEVKGEQRDREATADEAAQFDAQKAAAITEQAEAAKARAITDIEEQTGFTAQQRKFLLAHATDAGLLKALQSVDSAVVAAQAADLTP